MNGERCYHCGATETAHDLGLTDCANFVSKEQHALNCPGAAGGCFGSLFCEQTLASATADRAPTTSPQLWFNY